jgi:hypothetical protein
MDFKAVSEHILGFETLIGKIHRFLVYELGKNTLLVQRQFMGCDVCFPEQLHPGLLLLLR